MIYWNAQTGCSSRERHDKYSIVSTKEWTRVVTIKVSRERFWFGGKTVSCSECRHTGDIKMVSRSPDSSVGIAMDYRLDGWGSNPGRGKTSDRLWRTKSSPIQWAPKAFGPGQNRIALLSTRGILFNAQNYNISSCERRLRNSCTQEFAVASEFAHALYCVVCWSSE
jgi:hypothetical protein